VYIELPSISTCVARGDAVGAVESVKSASDIQSPVNGEVVSVNQTLDVTPIVVNRDPEGEGWIVKVRLEEGYAIEGMSEEEYKDFLEK
jgi:glycine cleavage system H protein